MTAPHPADGPSLVTRIVALVAGVAAVAGAIVLGSSSPAAAEGLEPFESCSDLQSHLADTMDDQVVQLEEAGAAIGGGDDMATADSAEGAFAPTASTLAARASEEAAGGDGTNTQVEGVDELDVVEVLDDGRILVARPDRVLVVSADGRRVLGSVAAGPDPQITFDDATATLWTVSTDGMSTVLLRAVLDGDSFRDVATWQVGGRFVSLRRGGEDVHLVVVDEDLSVPQPIPLPEPLPEPSTTSTTVPTTTTTEPEPTTTTVVEPEPTTTTTPVETTTTVAPDGPVEGAAVEATAFVPTQDGDGDGTAIPFGGTSPVPCDEVLHSPLPGGVATTLVATFTAEGELTPVAATEIVGAGDNVLVTDTALYVSTPSFDSTQAVTGIHRFDLAGLRHTGSGSVPGRLLNQFALDEHDGHLRAAVITGDGSFGRPMPVEGPAVDVIEDVVPTERTDVGDALNEIVVLDIDGALDVVGRTPRFGKPGETLHGIRFAGDVAYAVTFLQTDPFYVVDLARPAAPAVLGELEIPGFSAYLHPVAPDRVVGFGPDGQGKVAARLFDVGDPAHPAVLDTVAFADDSPVVYDHHALRVVGDELLVAATAFVAEPLPRCASVAPDDAARAQLETQVNDLYREMDELFAQLDQGSAGTPEERAALEGQLRDLELQVQGLSECAYPGAMPRAVIATIAPSGTSLGASTMVTEATEAWRVLPLEGGYLLVGADVTRVGTDGALQTTLG